MGNGSKQRALNIFNRVLIDYYIYLINFYEDIYNCQDLLFVDFVNFTMPLL